jgi:hypothetical protein
VLTIPVSNLERAVYELEFCHPIRSALSIAPAELTALNLAAHRPKIAPDKILLVEGIYDLFVPADTVKHLASAWGIPSWKRLKQSHISMLFSRGSMRECMDWLRDTLIEVHAGNGKHR